MKKLTFLISISFGLIFLTPATAQQIDPPSLQLSADLQRALEVDSVVDELQGIVVLCANACEPKSSSGNNPSQLGSPRGERASAQKNIGEGAQVVSGQRTVVPPSNKNSGMATGRRQIRPAATPAPAHDTAMAIIRKIGALSCQGAENCVDMIARKGQCKVGTVKCTTAGCGCTAK